MKYLCFILIMLFTSNSFAETEEQEKQRYCRRMAELIQNQDKDHPNVYAREYLNKYCNGK